METLTIKLPKGFLRKIDEVMKERDYPSRSAVIREAVRQFLREQGKKV